MGRNDPETTELSAIELLDLAADEARRRGHDCAGWTLQADADGYTAWLYSEDADWTPGQQVSLSSEVEVQATAEDAARECYLRACALPHSAEDAEA